MRLRRLISKPIAAVIVTLLTLGMLPLGASAHLGENGHIHAPGDATTHTSSVWCVQFTQDPGAWLPDGQSTIAAELIEATSLVFIDCAELLADHYTVESFVDGSVSRSTVNEPVIGEPGPSADVTTPEDGAAAAALTLQQWTKHQKKWLQKGDKLGNKLAKVRSVASARRALGDLQRHFKSEADWLKANKTRFEAESCLEEDMAGWQKRIKQAQQSLNKAITAMNRGNLAGTNSNIRQFGRAYTKVEQIYQIGQCDF